MAEEPGREKPKKQRELTEREKDILLQTGKQGVVGGKVPKPSLVSDILAGFSPEEISKINRNLRKRLEKGKK